MPGSGKSYFGKELSEALGYPFIDLDHEIESQERKAISEIFEAEGEEYFRRVESATLKFITEKYKEAIISTGGGTPCFYDGMDYMRAHGTTVFLQTEKALLIERIARKDHRPLMQGDVENRVDELLEKRLPIYEKAHISIIHRDVSLLLECIENLYL